MTNAGPPWNQPQPPIGYPPPSAQTSPGHTASQVERRSVSVLDWMAMGIGGLVLILSFFAYYTYAATSVEAQDECADPSAVPQEGQGVLHDLCVGTSASAWHGFFGWFGVLLAVAAAGLVAIAVWSPASATSGLARTLGRAAAVVGLISTAVALVVIPDWPALEDLTAAVGGSYSSSAYDQNVSDGHGISYWAILVLVAVLTAITFLPNKPVEAAAAPPPMPAGPPPGPWSGPA